jgi:hypothetical protein
VNRKKIICAWKKGVKCNTVACSIGAMAMHCMQPADDGKGGGAVLFPKEISANRNILEKSRQIYLYSTQSLAAGSHHTAARGHLLLFTLSKLTRKI